MRHHLTLDFNNSLQFSPIICIVLCVCSRFILNNVSTLIFKFLIKLVKWFRRELIFVCTANFNGSFIKIYFMHEKHPQKVMFMSLRKFLPLLNPALFDIVACLILVNVSQFFFYLNCYLFEHQNHFQSCGSYNKMSGENCLWMPLYI